MGFAVGEFVFSTSYSAHKQKKSMRSFASVRSDPYNNNYLNPFAYNGGGAPIPSYRAAELAEAARRDGILAAGGVLESDRDSDGDDTAMPSRSFSEKEREPDFVPSTPPGAIPETPPTDYYIPATPPPPRRTDPPRIDTDLKVPSTPETPSPINDDDDGGIEWEDDISQGLARSTIDDQPIAQLVAQRVDNDDDKDEPLDDGDVASITAPSTVTIHLTSSSSSSRPLPVVGSEEELYLRQMKSYM